MPSSSRGFTLIELIVVIAMLAILVSLAAPSFSTMAKNSRVSNLGNEFILGIGFARSEAIGRNKCVTMCVPKDINAPNLECATTGVEWNPGWIIFSNPKCDGKVDDTTAELLKAYVGNSAGPTLNGTGTPHSFTFDSRGRVTPLGAATSLNIAPPGEAATKMVCVDMLGRARVGNVGSISCDGTNRN
jgi:type IV fimbrial biogenesis protein FimT